MNSTLEWDQNENNEKINKNNNQNKRNKQQLSVQVPNNLFAIQMLYAHV